MKLLIFNICVFREPDFSNIKKGSRVLAKQKNKLWHRSIVLKIPEDKDDEYQVKFEASGNIIDVGISDILPLGNLVHITNWIKNIFCKKL